MKNEMIKECYRVYRKALRKGELVRLDYCENCLVECKPDGHHPDHEKPLDVVWLCKDCHFKVHNEFLYLVNPICDPFFGETLYETFHSRTSKKLKEKEKKDLYRRLKFKTKKEIRYEETATSEEMENLYNLQEEINRRCELIKEIEKKYFIISEELRELNGIRFQYAQELRKKYPSYIVDIDQSE